MKSERQAAIIDLITRYEIETQEDMIDRLRAAGYDVTQATVSRDIRELRLSKVQSSHGGYRYVKNTVRQPSANVKFNNAVVDSIPELISLISTIVLSNICDNFSEFSSTPLIDIISNSVNCSPVTNS